MNETRIEKVTTNSILVDVDEEVDRATQKHGPIRSAHEGYAVVLEELDELKAEVWKNGEDRDYQKMRMEAIQVAAMAVRFVRDLEI